MHAPTCIYGTRHMPYPSYLLQRRLWMICIKLCTVRSNQRLGVKMLAQSLFVLLSKHVEQVFMIDIGNNYIVYGVFALHKLHVCSGKFNRDKRYRSELTSLPRQLWSTPFYVIVNCMNVFPFVKEKALLIGSVPLLWVCYHTLGCSPST